MRKHPALGRASRPLLGPQKDGVDHRVFTTGGFALDDAAGFDGAVLGVLDAVADAWNVCSKLGIADDDLQVACLVRGLELFGFGLEDQGANGEAGVRSRDLAGSGVIGGGGVGLEVGDVLAPIGKDLGWKCCKGSVDEAHINLCTDGRRN